MKNFACLVALATALGGCASAEELAASDNADCQSYGAQPGSSAYYQCRMVKNRDRLQLQEYQRERFSEGMMVLGAEISNIR